MPNAPTPDGTEEIIFTIKKFFAWFLPSSFGVATKLAYESRLKNLSKKYIFTALIMSCFVGYLCDIGCTYYGLITFRGPIVALGALVSESLISFFFQNDKSIIKGIVARIFGFKIETDNNNKNVKDGDNNDNIH